MATAVRATARAFTSRQVEVVRLIAAGATQKGVALALGISERTVKTHSVTLRHKLGVYSFREIPLAYMRETGDNPFPVTP